MTGSALRFSPPTIRASRDLQPDVPALSAAASNAPLSALRAATRSHHDRLDRLMDLRRLGEHDRYTHVLQVFDGFLPAWEAAVLAALPSRWHDWLSSRSRRPFLARDLQALGAAGTPAAARVAPLGSEAAAWGSLYVLEGSALGGQVITRALAARGWQPDNGAAYFHGWGGSTGAMWREFRHLLESELRAPDSLSLACASACQTFDTLTGLLEHALHERSPAA